CPAWCGGGPYDDVELEARLRRLPPEGQEHRNHAVRLARTRGDGAEVSAQRGTSGATNGPGGRSAPAPADHNAQKRASAAPLPRRIVMQTTSRAASLASALSSLLKYLASGAYRQNAPGT